MSGSNDLRRSRDSCALDADFGSAALDDTAIFSSTSTDLPAYVPQPPAEEMPPPKRISPVAATRRQPGRTLLIVGGMSAAAAACNVICYIVLSFTRHVTLTGTGVGYTFRPVGLWDWLAVLFPMGAIGIAAICLSFEAWVLGWDRSSLRRLLQPRTVSTRTDLFYMFLVISGLKNLLTFLFTLGAGLGAGYWLHAQIEGALGYSLLANVPFPLALAAVAVVNTFTFYWVHRIMHSRFLWEIHKVHHAAEEMNIITPHRNHPLDHAVVLAVNALPAAIMGASPVVVITYIVLNGIYQELVHTDMDWNLSRWRLGWIEKYFLLSSTAHRIHHSRSRRHFDKNFGITPVWDRLFGTYYEPRGEQVQVGLDDEPEHNTGRPLRELWRVYRQWLRVAGRELARLVSGKRTTDDASSQPTREEEPA